MAKSLATYDPAQLYITMGGFALSGFVKGSFITVERNENAFTGYVGADGEGARAKSNDKSSKITLRFMASSDSNDILMGFAKADEVSNSGAAPFMAKDGNGRSVIACENAWIEKLPSVDFGVENGEREWILATDSSEIFVGGE